MLLLLHTDVTLESIFFFNKHRHPIAYGLRYPSALLWLPAGELGHQIDYELSDQIKYSTC